jgi:hypothetical protein
MKDEEKIPDYLAHTERARELAIDKRLAKLEHDVQTLLIGFTLLSLSMFFLVRELYAMPEPTGVTK